MTGANIDRVHVPDYQIAAAIVLSLATPLFHRAMGRGFEPEPGEECFEAWHTLRRCAETFYRDHSMRLAARDREGMIGALKLCHTLAHDREINEPSVERCDCLTAERLSNLALLMAASEARGTGCGGKA